MKTFYVLCGCPASGKSTYVENIFKNSQKTVAIVSRDEIRFSLLEDGEDYFSKEDEVLKLFYERISENLANPYVDIVVADATHLNQKSRSKLFSNIDIPEECRVYAIAFETSLDECLRRNEKREGRAKVPRGVLRRMYYSYTRPTPVEGFDAIYIL